MEASKVKKIDLKQFKGHQRRFPWTMIIRVFVAFATIAMIWFLMEWTKEIAENRKIREVEDDAIEIEYQP